MPCDNGDSGKHRARPTSWFQSCWAPSETTSFLLSALTELSRFFTLKASASPKTTLASSLQSSHRSCGTRLASLGRPQSSRPRLSCACISSCSLRRARSAFATTTRTGLWMAKISTTGEWCVRSLLETRSVLEFGGMHPPPPPAPPVRHCLLELTESHLHRIVFSR